MNPLRLLCAAVLLCGRVSSGADNYRFVNWAAAQLESRAQDSINDFASAEGQQRRRAELMDMFGLEGRERTDLKAVVTGRLEDETVVVEKVQFQSSPGLYVIGNFFLPKQFTGKLPAVLYVCGHSEVKTNGVSLGNKTAYQHHGAWFARNGYACLVIDTVQLGEIPGLHHGTYREGMWWWNSRGYSPAAVEAWNCIRALDYLETRPEVDKDRFGITGRSGGGAYSWYTAALDSRIKAAAPVAGITDLRNHVIDGTVEGHCDCMFFVNTFGWDYPMLAACAAPKSLLLVNTDADSIFPLDGVVRTHSAVAAVYRKLGRTNDLGLVIGPGPHKDTQDLQVPVFRWFNKALRGSDPIIDLPATNHFAPADLRVFKELPADQRNTNVHEWFIAKAAPGPTIRDGEQWRAERDVWMRALREKVFRNWFDTQTEESCLEPAGNQVWRVKDSRPTTGLDKKSVTQLRRRYMLVGTTMDSMRVHDIVRSVAALPDHEVILEAEGDAAVNALFASLLSSKVTGLRLKNLPASLDREGPDYLNVLKYLDVREALAMATEKTNLELEKTDADTAYATSLHDALHWGTKLQVSR